jgi:AraC-like DNA-binding protein
MQVASQKLRNTNASLAQVAETVGYDPEAAFSIGKLWAGRGSNHVSVG